MITNSPGSEDRVTPYNEVLGVLMTLIRNALKEMGKDDKIVMAKTSFEKDVNRAPLILVKRGPVTYSPDSVMLSEAKGANSISTAHILNYAIIFESFGNSYAEAEEIGNIVLETILATGQTVISSLHPAIAGARLDNWTESSQTDPKESKYTNSLTANVFLIVGGLYQTN